jgi:hypothetical protein
MHASLHLDIQDSHISYILCMAEPLIYIYIYIYIHTYKFIYIYNTYIHKTCWQLFAMHSVALESIAGTHVMLIY